MQRVGEGTEQAVEPRRLSRVARRPRDPGAKGHLRLHGAEGRGAVERTRRFRGAAGKRQERGKDRRAGDAHQ